MGLDLSRIDWQQVLIYLLVVVLSITVHEFSHALAAVSLGDDLPRRQGRLTLLPTEHFDPIGFTMIVLMAFGSIGLGWGKPVMVDPRAFRHPRRDMTIVAAAGPFSNLLLAVLCGLLLRIPAVLAGGLVAELLLAGMLANLGLMLFNLIPIPPLDGSKILSNFLPFEQSVRYDRVMGQYGFMILIALIFFGGPVLRPIIDEPRIAMARLIVGQ